MHMLSIKMKYREQYSIGETDCPEFEWKLPERLAGTIEKSGERRNVIFALIVTEPASECVYVR